MSRQPKKCFNQRARRWNMSSNISFLLFKRWRRKLWRTHFDVMFSTQVDEQQETSFRDKNNNNNENNVRTDEWIIKMWQNQLNACLNHFTLPIYLGIVGEKSTAKFIINKTCEKLTRICFFFGEQTARGMRIGFGNGNRKKFNRSSRQLRKYECIL